MIKFFSLFISFFMLCAPVRGILIELLDGDFSYIVDTKSNKATIKRIYIPAKVKKDIEIPQYVEDFSGVKYKVEILEERAIKNVINRVKSLKLPESVMKDERNYKAMTWFLIYDIPIETYAC